MSQETTPENGRSSVPLDKIVSFQGGCNMNEKQYIIATNRVKISMALQILRDVLPGDEYGITATELSHIRIPLSLIETRLFGATEIEPEEN